MEVVKNKYKWGMPTRITSPDHIDYGKWEFRDFLVYTVDDFGPFESEQQALDAKKRYTEAKHELDSAQVLIDRFRHYVRTGQRLAVIVYPHDGTGNLEEE